MKIWNIGRNQIYGDFVDHILFFLSSLKISSTKAYFSVVSLSYFMHGQQKHPPKKSLSFSSNQSNYFLIYPSMRMARIPETVFRIDTTILKIMVVWLVSHLVENKNMTDKTTYGKSSPSTLNKVADLLVSFESSSTYRISPLNPSRLGS